MITPAELVLLLEVKHEEHVIGSDIPDCCFMHGAIGAQALKVQAGASFSHGVN